MSFSESVFFFFLSWDFLKTLFSSVLFTCKHLRVIFLLLISGLILLLSESILCKISIFKICWSVLYGLGQGLFWWMSHWSLRRLYILLLMNINVNLIWLIEDAFLFSLSLPIFPPRDLSTTDRCVLKSLIIIYICHFSLKSLSFCLKRFDTLLLGE